MVPQAFGRSDHDLLRLAPHRPWHGASPRSARGPPHATPCPAPVPMTVTVTHSWPFTISLSSTYREVGNSNWRRARPPGDGTLHDAVHLVPRQFQLLGHGGGGG